MIHLRSRWTALFLALVLSLSLALPASAAEGMKAQGIDLRQLNLGAIVDVFEELEEDIVNVRVKDAHNDLLVRVYVE